MTPLPEASAIEVLRIEADDLSSAHERLGAALREAIGSVVDRRRAATEPGAFEEQIRTIRRCRAHLEAKARSPEVAGPVRDALGAYLDALGAWARGADLASRAGAPHVDAAPITALDLALWLQDDTTGCQTGALRVEDGSVLLWHTEEDTIGYFDRTRLVEMRVGERSMTAFLYPYLLPGPAFGWHERGLVAYDTLTTRRTESGGTPTSTLSWLLWSTRGALDTATTLRSLAPFLDGGAFTVATRTPEGVVVETIEVGGDVVASDRLGLEPGAARMQVNLVTPRAEALVAVEALSEEDRAPYRERLARAARFVGVKGGRTDPADLLAMLSSGEGGGWAFANGDVVAHLVARVSSEEMALHVGAGPAKAGDPLRWSFVVR